MDALTSVSDAFPFISTTVQQNLRVAKENFHAVQGTVQIGLHVVLDHLSPRKRRRLSSASIVSPLEISAPHASAASIHPPTPLPFERLAKRPRLADPESESSHLPILFLPPGIPLFPETPSRSQKPQSHPNPRIEAAVMYGLVISPCPSYPAIPATHRPRIHASDVRQQFFRRCYAALRSRGHLSEPPSSSTKITAKTTRTTSVRKSVPQVHSGEPQRRIVSTKVLASKTRLLPSQGRTYSHPYRSHKTSPKHRLKHPASEASVKNDSQPKSLPTNEAPEVLPSPTMRAEQISKLHPVISNCSFRTVV